VVLNMCWLFSLSWFPDKTLQWLLTSYQL
jgi:hypothetical protein